MSVSTVGKRGKCDIDSGRAWVVLPVVYLGAAILSCTIHMHGVQYVAILDRFADDEAKTSLISAVSLGLLCFASPLGGMLNNRISCRFSIMSGAILSTIGLCTSPFVSSVDGLIVTVGACSGVGTAFYTTGMECLLGFYFQKYRNTMLAGYYLVVGAGMIAATPMCIYLVETLGLPMTFTAFGCMQAQVCIIGALCKPSSVEIASYQERTNRCREKDKLLGQAGLDWSVLRKKAYFLFLLSVVSWVFSAIAIVTHFPNYIHLKGGSYETMSFLMMTYAVTNVIGRAIATILISRYHQHCLLLQTISLAITGVLTTFFWSYSHMPGGAYIFVIQAGVCLGIPNALIIPLALKLAGVTKISEATSFTYVACGVGMLGAPVVLGYIHGVTHSYANSFIVSGVVLLTGTFCSLLSMCSFKMESRISDTEIQT